MDNLLGSAPEHLPEIEKRCLELGFEMASDEQAGSLLRSLVASKPGGNFLELGMPLIALVIERGHNQVSSNAIELR